MARKKLSIRRFFRNITIFLFVSGFVATIMGWKTIAEWSIVGILILVAIALPVGLVINAGKPKKKLDYDEDDIREALMH